MLRMLTKRSYLLMMGTSISPAIHQTLRRKRDVCSIYRSRHKQMVDDNLFDGCGCNALGGGEEYYHAVVKENSFLMSGVVVPATEKLQSIGGDFDYRCFFNTQETFN
jgi:hypothetical protein